MSLILSGTDGLSDVDGSAATPAIRGTDANTGIFFPAADTIAFAEGGVEAARFDSSGQLGIGTTSPAQTLHVKTSTASTPITLGVLSDATGLAALSFNGAYASTTMSGTYHSSGALNYTVPSGSIFNFRIADASKMILNSSGNLQTIGTISVGNATPSTSGAGITFPATQVASSDANTLDDYEEGTWTPIIAGSTSGSKTAAANNYGWYVKIGRVVHLGATIDWNGGSAIVGNTVVTGLPFASNSTLNARSSGSVGANNGVTVTSSNWLSVSIDPGNTFAYLVANAPNATYATNPAVSSSGTLFGFSLTYQTA